MKLSRACHEVVLQGSSSILLVVSPLVKPRDKSSAATEIFSTTMVIRAQARFEGMTAEFKHIFDAASSTWSHCLSAGMELICAPVKNAF